MPKFYYQIKGKLNEPEQGFFGGVSNWCFPPIFSGIVEAENKKLAKKIIDEDYDRVFPLRVLSKDLKDNEFLLSIEEIKPNSHLSQLDELKTCNNCAKKFYVIDKYNDYHDPYKGSEYCSTQCKDEHYHIKRQKQIELNNQNLFENSTTNNNFNGDINKAIIYKITNKNNDKCYIGKTTQIFTLRWYQHFFQSGNNKFHNEIKNVKVTDWQFEVIEAITYPESIKYGFTKEKNDFILERERYYINLYDAVNNGYNTLNT